MQTIKPAVKFLQQLKSVKTEENRGKQALLIHRFTPASSVFLALVIAMALLANPALANDQAATSDAPARYRAAKSQYEDAPNNVTNAWRFARACFELADQSPDKSHLESIAEEGVAAGHAAVAVDPQSAAAHYYLALNIGALAQTKLLGALKLVRQMEAELLRSIALQPGYDHAGAERSLGMLYRDTPGWPASIGSKSKARKQLESAVKLAPDYPDNHLTLIESYLEWEDYAAAKKASETFKKIKDDSRKKYSGAQWNGPWRDWDRRWAAILEKLRSED